LGAKGLVIGCITKESQIDTEFLEMFSKEINTDKIDVTFHKASDYTQDLPGAYETLQKYGISRVLTQGGSASLLDNSETIR
jgi:copper homeostasis protein CutC